jgi:hypothetical protein
MGNHDTTIKPNETSFPAITGDFPKPELMDEKAAAGYLGKLSPKTLQAWRLRGTGPIFRKIGRTVRYLREDLDHYIQQQARQSTSQTGIG